MAARKHWSDLSKRSRRLLIAAAAVEGCLKIAALIDIKRRPASQIRGRKLVWAAVVTVVNSAGAAPISYFVFGRPRQPRSQPGSQAAAGPMPRRRRRLVSRRRRRVGG